LCGWGGGGGGGGGACGGRRARLHTAGSQRLTAPVSKLRVLCDWSEIRSGRYGFAVPLASSVARSRGPQISRHTAMPHTRTRTRPSVSVRSQPPRRPARPRRAELRPAALLPRWLAMDRRRPSGGRRDRRDGDAPAPAHAAAPALTCAPTTRGVRLGCPRNFCGVAPGFLRCFLLGTGQPTRTWALLYWARPRIVVLLSSFLLTRTRLK
jgi:hypothetical protein